MVGCALFGRISLLLPHGITLRALSSFPWGNSKKGATQGEAGSSKDCPHLPWGQWKTKTLECRIAGGSWKTGAGCATASWHSFKVLSAPSAGEAWPGLPSVPPPPPSPFSLPRLPSTLRGRQAKTSSFPKRQKRGCFTDKGIVSLAPGGDLAAAVGTEGKTNLSWPVYWVGAGGFVNLEGSSPFSEKGRKPGESSATSYFVSYPS